MKKETVFSYAVPIMITLAILIIPAVLLYHYFPQYDTAYRYASIFIVLAVVLRTIFKNRTK